jgi:integrase
MLKGLKISNNTRRKYRIYIGMFFKWVMEEGHITSNPATGIKYKTDGYDGSFYSPEQTKKLLCYVVENHKDLAGYFALMTFAGLRPTEGQRVQWEDYFPKVSQLYVRDGKTNAVSTTGATLGIAVGGRRPRGGDGRRNGGTCPSL